MIQRKDAASYAWKRAADHSTGRVPSRPRAATARQSSATLRIGKNRKWIEPEARQVAVALRMQRTNILVRGQLEAFAVHNARFFELREQHIATHRGGKGSGEEAMIAPGVEANERRRSKSPKTIRFQPLTLCCCLQIRAALEAKGDHCGCVPLILACKVCRSRFCN